MNGTLSWHRYLLGQREGTKVKFTLGDDMLAGDKYLMLVVLMEVKNGHPEGAKEAPDAEAEVKFPQIRPYSVNENLDSREFLKQPKSI